MGLFHRYLITETKRLMNATSACWLWEIPSGCRHACATLAETVAATRDNRGMTVALALSYGGRQDIVNAARSIARAVADGAFHQIKSTNNSSRANSRPPAARS